MVIYRDCPLEIDPTGMELEIFAILCQSEWSTPVCHDVHGVRTGGQINFSTNWYIVTGTTLTEHRVHFVKDFQLPSILWIFLTLVDLRALREALQKLC